MLIAHAGRDHPTARADHVHSLGQGCLLALHQMIMSNGLDDTVGSGTARDLQHSLDRVLILDVDGIVHT